VVRRKRGGRGEKRFPSLLFLGLSRKKDCLKKGGVWGAAGVGEACPATLGGKPTAPGGPQHPLISPTDGLRTRLYEFVGQTPDERTAWEESFAEAIGL